MPAVRSLSGPVAAIRRFNRDYTRRIGVLRQDLLGSAYSLTEVRVLYEIAHRPGLTAAALRRDLGLDAGYLSRMLARFVRAGLLRRVASADDARAALLRLSARGQKTFAALDARSNAEVASLLEHLPAAEQGRLAETLRTASHLLTKPEEPRPAVQLRPPRPGDLGWVVQRHGALYAREYGWNQEFEALVAGIVADFGRRHDPATERCWIAEMDGHSVGCIFLVRESGSVAKLRLLLVEPSARGAGVGRLLVEACTTFARRAGYRKVTLWTNSVLDAARRIYERAGFKLVTRERHRSFGKSLEGQNWELVLAATES